MSRLTVGTLFSGIGVGELAAHQLGLEVRWACESDRFCRKVLQRHWPDLKVYPDVRTVDPLELGRVDVLVCGFPCQDVSVAGERAGLAGNRTALFWDVVRVANALRPDWVVLENVPGLLSSWSPVAPPADDLSEGEIWETTEGSDMESVLCALSDLGYVGAWRVLDAQWFRVAQQRRRVWIVGGFGAARGRALLPFLESGCRDPRPRRTKRAGDCAEAEGDAGDGGERVGALTSGHGSRDAAGAASGHVVGSLMAPPPGGGYRVGADEAAAGHVIPVDVAHTLTSRQGRGTTRPGRGQEDDYNLVGAGEITGTVSSKWSKGSGGPAGDETYNLIAVQDATYDARDQNGLGIRDGETDPMFTLDSRGAHGIAEVGCAGAEALYFEPRHLTRDKAGGALSDRAGTLTSEADGDGRPHVAVFAQNQRDEVREQEIPGALAAEPGAKQQSYLALQRGEIRVGVRRLTPTECERLQGLPDGWTCLCGQNQGRSWSASGPVCRCKDSPRYRAIGNAFCLPNARWVLARIVEAAQETGAG